MADGRVEVKPALAAAPGAAYHRGAHRPPRACHRVPATGRPRRAGGTVSMLDTQTIYLTMTGIHVVTGLAWLINGLAAFGSWRTFRVQADLAWLLAFLLLAVVTAARAVGSYALYQQVISGALAASTVDLLGDIEIDRLRFAALEMVAALATLVAFRARRVNLD